MPKLSSTASAILTILNNINELIVLSSDRQKAKEVMHALTVYADNKRFSLPSDKIESFYAILIDSRPYTLTSLIKDIAEDIVTADTQRKNN